MICERNDGFFHIMENQGCKFLDVKQSLSHDFWNGSIDRSKDWIDLLSDQLIRNTVKTIK